jgi:hypothetical protein
MNVFAYENVEDRQQRRLRQSLKICAIFVLLVAAIPVVRHVYLAITSRLHVIRLEREMAALAGVEPADQIPFAAWNAMEMSPEAKRDGWYQKPFNVEGSDQRVILRYNETVDAFLKNCPGMTPEMTRWTKTFVPVDITVSRTRTEVNCSIVGVSLAGNRTIEHCIAVFALQISLDTQNGMVRSSLNTSGCFLDLGLKANTRLKVQQHAAPSVVLIREGASAGEPIWVDRTTGYVNAPNK